MLEGTLWFTPLYRETVGLVLLFLFSISAAVFFIRNNSTYLSAVWASLKSWLFVAPLLFFIFGLPEPWPLVFMMLVAIYAIKTFYQIVGMYHRTWFVWSTYLFVMGLTYAVHINDNNLYHLSPMMFLAFIATIPLFRNSANRMVQYISLSSMAATSLGWSFLHLGRILPLENGVYIVIYLFILCEFSEVVTMAYNRKVGKIKILKNISSRVSIDGIFISLALTLLLAWGLRHMLPVRSELYWVAAGLGASFLGRFGDLFLSVVRKDLGIKDTGIFILGRGDILRRVDKMVFVAPFYYFLLVSSGVS